MFNRFLLALAACTSLTHAVPFPTGSTLQDTTSNSNLQTRAGDPENCPGYEASNVVKTDSTLTADLTLAGNACNVYSEDIKDLKLVVEYQTSMYSFISIRTSGVARSVTTTSS
jgi:alpha-glucosidase